jgi:hypothetical protein
MPSPLGRQLIEPILQRGSEREPVLPVAQLVAFEALVHPRNEAVEVDPLQPVGVVGLEANAGAHGGGPRRLWVAAGITDISP